MDASVRPGEKDTRSFYRAVFSLVVPMALQNLINVAVTSADVIMLGMVEDQNVLPAASLAGQVQFIMTLFLFGLTSGAAVLTSQYWGKGDIRAVEKVLGITLRFSMGIGALFTAAVLLFPTPIMHIFTPDPAVAAQGVIYLRIVCFSYLLMSVTMVYLNILRSVERVVISTVIYLISLMANILINGVLIFGLFGLPAMGIAGAAVGTLCARALELMIAVAYSRRRDVPIRLHPRELLVRDRLLFLDFLRYSIPVTLNELMWGLGTSMVAVVIGHLNNDAVSANAVAQVARQLATVISFGIAGAAAILIGKAIGEGRTAVAEDYARRFIRLTLISGAAGAAVVLAVRPLMLAAMSLTPVAREYLSLMMIAMAAFVFCQAYNSTLVVGVFRAGGDTRFGLALDVGTMWGGSILLGALAAFVFQWSVPAVYMMLLSDELLKIPFSTWRYKGKKWLRNVTREEELSEPRPGGNPTADQN